MRLFLVLALIGLSAAAVAVQSVETVDNGVDWIEPAFVESLEESFIQKPTTRAWHRTASSELAPEHEHHSFAEHTSSVQVESGASLEAQLAATITAEGKTEAQLMAEIELKAPKFWEEFKAKFGKVYKDEKARFVTFMTNLVRIAKLNAQALFSKITRKLRAVYSHLTPHADLSPAEFKALLTHKVDPKVRPVSPPAPRGVVAGAGRAVGPNNLAPRTTLLEIESESEVEDGACWVGGGSTVTKGVCMDEKACVGTVWPGACSGAANIMCCVKGAPTPAPVAPVVQPVVQPVDPPSAPAAPVVAPTTTPARAPVAPASPGAAPVDVDFRDQSTPIKAQGTCGSCYAFASVSVLESAWNLKYNQLYTLSPQHLMDCLNGADACGGASPFDALEYLENHGGSVTDALVPYLEKPSGTCVNAKDKMPAGSTPIRPTSVSWAIKTRQTKQDENELGHQLAYNGPMVVAVDADSFQFYSAGVMGSETSCSKDPSNPNHAIVLEGLGTDASSGQRYWIIRNQWSTRWGENGRARMAFDQNVCGVANWPIKITV